MRSFSKTHRSSLVLHFIELLMLQRIHQWFHKKACLEAIQILKQQVNAELAQQNFKAAKKTLMQIITLDADEEEALITLCKVLLQQGKFEESYQVLQRVTDLNTKHCQQVLAFVQAYEDSGMLEKIEELLLMAIQKAPHMLELRLCLAQHLFEQTRHTEAETQLLTILKKEPEHLQAHIGLAYCYLQTGSKTKALGQVKKIRQLDEKQAEILISAIYENVQNFN